MKTIQMTIDETLLKAVDRLCRTRRTSRSALIRAALESELERDELRRREEKHRKGYERQPVKADEFDAWVTEQEWGDA